jgi:flagellar hook-associated protein 1
VSVSTLMGLQTALRGLLAQQRALEVTSHNIANANTAGYSRQEAIMAASSPLRIPAGSTQQGGAADLGSGVDVLAYRRIRDTFLDLQYRTQSMRLSDQQARMRSLDQVELALAEPGENGISRLLDRFWSSWGDLANAPESQAVRQSLVEGARTLASAFGSLDAQLVTVQQQAADEYAQIAAAGGEVGQLANEIARLNEAIRSAVGTGAQPNDLLDRRDALLDRLSGLAQVSTQDLGDGMVRVSFGDAAVPLVDGVTVTWPQALTDPKGKLGALIDLASPTGTIAAYRADLNAAARQLADSVNAIHDGGSGVPFFSYAAGSEAATLAVAVAPAAVRASSTGAAGGNDLALAIGALRGGAADQAYGLLVNRIGTDVREAGRLEANARVLLDAIQDRRDSASGVSVDEEMTNLIRFQRGYQAAARAMSTFDEMLDVLINRTGRVGL